MITYEAILEHKNALRIAFFIFLILFFSLIEFFFPLIKKKRNGKSRFNNFSLAFFNSFFQGFVFPGGLFLVASAFHDNSWGLFHQLPFLSNWPVFEWIISILILDFFIYWQHRFFHKIPFFWRFHKVHHADASYDLSLGLRFHFLELFFSSLLKIFIVLIFGIDPLAFLFFEVLLSSFSLFHHSNIAFPWSVEKHLHKFIVTPKMHVLHHSKIESVSNSNFSFSVSFWDQIFSSFTPVFNRVHEETVVGIDENTEESFFGLLTLPFRKKK